MRILFAGPEHAAGGKDGIDCVVIPPHVVTEPKVNRVKTDKRDARRLAKVLDDHDFKDGSWESSLHSPMGQITLLFLPSIIDASCRRICYSASSNEQLI